MSTAQKNQPTKNKRGGKRVGAGRPKGSKKKPKSEKEATLEKFKQRVRMRANRLLNAQASLAEGLQYMYKVEKVEKTSATGKVYTSKKHVLVTDPEEIAQALDEGLGKGEYCYYLTTKDPDNKAIDSLLDRAYGRAVQSVDHTSMGEKVVPILGGVTAITNNEVQSNDSNGKVAKTE